MEADRPNESRRTLLDGRLGHQRQVRPLRVVVRGTGDRSSRCGNRPARIQHHRSGTIPQPAAEGGKTRLVWDSDTDVDLHIWDQYGNHAYFGDMDDIPSGYLDQDIITGRRAVPAL